MGHIAYVQPRIKFFIKNEITLWMYADDTSYENLHVRDKSQQSGRGRIIVFINNYLPG